MRKLICTILSFLLITSFSYSQSSNFEGKIIDSSEKKPLSNCSIVLLNKADSILVGFTRSDKEGNFSLKNIPAGKFLVLFTLPKYADFTDTLTLADNAELNMGNIYMTLKAELLKAFIVRQQISSIKIKGDTTEFTADSFRVQPNATVEDLLKKLPGIQVDKNGQITAQGEKVQKVLVDGEEFFGDDPTLVTKNLRADMIDKVQVYDKKSDQAAFTGIDDGQKQKTINLKMKEGKKNGYFGKMTASAGTDGYHDSQLMFNKFKNKEKLAFYGIVSNTGTSGLNWQDRDNYGQSFASSLSYDETMGYYMFTSNSDELDSWNGRYNGQGYPLVQTGGIHYNNKWNDDKFNLNANYKIMQLGVTGSSATNSQVILPDTFYYNNSKQNFTNRILRNSFNGSFEFQIDSNTSIKLNADAGIDHKTTNTNGYSEALASDSSIVNQGSNYNSSDGDKKFLNSNLLFKKKLKKKGRTLSFNLNETFSDDATTGYLYSSNGFYSKGILAETQITDQYKTFNSRSTQIDTKLTYTEPLTKVSSLIANYGVVVSNSSSATNSFNKDNVGKYTQLDSVYSNDYGFNIITQRTGLAYSLFQKKFKMNLGSNIGFSNFIQKNEMNDSSSTRKFVNWYPQANMRYQFSQYRSISIGYNGSTQQPSIQQIQPLKVNSNPLNINVGNPALKPAFYNRFNLNFNDWKMLSERNIYVGTNFSFIQNNISSSSSVDSFGRTVTQAVNLNGNQSYGAYIGYGFKIKKIDTHIGFDGNINSYRNNNIVNNNPNTTNSNSYSLSMNISKSKEKKYELNLSGGATFTNSLSSIQQGITTQYWTYNINPSFDIFLPLKFQIHSDADISIRQKTPVFTSNNNVVIWNAWFGKKFLKNDALLLKVTGNDLLDQNTGFSRSVNSNFITQTTYSTIRRYYMLSITWNFTKAGTKMPGQDQ